MTSQLNKAPTGVKGLDDITGGGLPAGRMSLLCGGPGCGKTLLATSFIDPLSALEVGGSMEQATLMVLRLIDFLKSSGATALCLSIQEGDDKTNLNISSLMDSWITVRNVQRDDKLERQLFIVKSRGMSHSADVRRLVIGAEGVQVRERRETS